MISIIIPTKNGGKWLNRSLTSIEEQTEKDFEVIIVSDGSTDNTAQIARELSETRPWLRIIELKENIGPGLARDKGIREAKGDLIALLDDDDEWVSKFKLAVQKDFLLNNPEYVLVGATTITEINDAGGTLSVFKLPYDDASIRSTMFRRNCFVTSSVMFRKDSYLKAGGFSTMYLAEDYDLWFRFGLLGKFANLDKCDINYTIHQQGASKLRQIELYKNILLIIKNHKNNYPNYAVGYIKAKLRVIYVMTFGRILNISSVPFLRKLFREVA